VRKAPAGLFPRSHQAEVLPAAAGSFA
jgi:hypothetical protein